MPHGIIEKIMLVEIMGILLMDPAVLPVGHGDIFIIILIDLGDEKMGQRGNMKTVTFFIGEGADGFLGIPVHDLFKQGFGLFIVTHIQVKFTGHKERVIGITGVREFLSKHEKLAPHIIHHITHKSPLFPHGIVLRHIILKIRDDVRRIDQNRLHRRSPASGRGFLRLTRTSCEKSDGEDDGKNTLHLYLFLLSGLFTLYSTLSTFSMITHPLLKTLEKCRIVKSTGG